MGIEDLDFTPSPSGPLDQETIERLMMEGMNQRVRRSKLRRGLTRTYYRISDWFIHRRAWRSKKEIKEAHNMYFDRVWSERVRHDAMHYINDPEKQMEDSDFAAKATQILAKHDVLVEKYGLKFMELDPNLDHDEYTFQWGMISGTLSTLRWIMGDEWGNLDS